MTARLCISLPIAGLCVPLLLGLEVAFGADSANDCAAIEAADERLACFDRVFGSSEDAQAEGRTAEPAAAAPAQDAGVSAAAAAAAGASAVSSEEADFGLEKPKSETEGKSLTSGIARVGKDGYGKLIFELENGQVWQQTEYKRFSAREGQTAVIRHGSFGSYKMYIEGKSIWTRVRRVE